MRWGDRDGRVVIHHLLLVSQDCVRIYQAVSQLPGLVTLLQDYDGSHKALLTNNFITSLEVRLLLVSLD